MLIKKDENYLIPTADYFPKDPYDVINWVKTCSQTEKQKTIGWKSMINYFNRKREKQNYIIGTFCKILLLSIKIH